MPIVGKFFPSQKSEEKVFLLLRRHWFTYLGFLSVAIVASIPVIALVVAAVNDPNLFNGPFGNVLIIALFVYLLMVLGVMLYGFIDYYLDVYIITNERVVSIEQNGFFRREISELHLHQIQDVSAKVNGLLPTLVHYGDIFIQTAGERENFDFKSIPNPYRVSKLIVDLHEAQLERGTAQTEEQNIIADYSEEAKGKMRDKFDLESIDPQSLSLARKRTKDFLQGGPLEETELKTQVQEELASQKYDKLLENVKNSAKYDIPNEVTPGQTQAKTEAGSEGEIKENEEIELPDKE